MHFPLKSSRSHSAPGDPRGERAVLGVAFVAVRALGAQARFLPVGGVGTVASSTVRWRPGINRPGRWTHTGRRSAQGELACKMQGCGRGVSVVPSALPAAPISAGGGGGSGSPPPGWNPQPGRGQRLLPTLWLQVGSRTQLGQSDPATWGMSSRDRAAGVRGRGWRPILSLKWIPLWGQLGAQKNQVLGDIAKYVRSSFASVCAPCGRFCYVSQ